MANNENITRAEAADRAALLNCHRYIVDLDLSGTDASFPVTTTISFSCTRPGAMTWLDHITDVHSVELNGEPLDVAEVVKGGRIELPDLRAEKFVVVNADKN